VNFITRKITEKHLFNFQRASLFKKGEAILRWKWQIGQAKDIF